QENGFWISAHNGALAFKSGSFLDTGENDCHAFDQIVGKSMVYHGGTRGGCDRHGGAAAWSQLGKGTRAAADRRAIR
ncbi:MAG TPA: hypothetical protein VKR81_14615, partial [Candidatus Binatia bacterium]|nr:hypothetical protein [Candidatus Binatia bacterium]